MTREEFYNEILKLAPSEYDASKCEFQKHLEYILNSYYKLLDELDEDERPKVGYTNWEMTRNVITKLINAINETVRLYYNGLHSEAFIHLETILNEEYLPNESLNALNPLSYFYNDDFYRMRIFDDGEKHDRDGMFHIPFNKRTIVKTQRYSIPGYPCLYLGKSAYVCWEEMLRPNLDKCYVSRVQSIDGFSPVFYNMTLLSKKDIMKADEQLFRQALLRLPLVLACMVKVANPKDTFKPEYIISQLLMEYIIKYIYENETIIGVAYTSVHKSDDFDFDSEKSINLVIPAIPSPGNKYSEALCKMFQLTEPTCDELERAKCPYKAIKRDKKMSDLEYNYRISTFGQLEARLKDKTKFPLDKIDNSTFGS